MVSGEFVCTCLLTPPLGALLTAVEVVRVMSDPEGSQKWAKDVAAARALHLLREASTASAAVDDAPRDGSGTEPGTTPEAVESVE